MWMISSDHKSSTSTTDDVCPSHPRWEKNYAYIAWARDISQGDAHSIVHNQLDYWKVGRWVSKNLTDNHKAHCIGPLSQTGHIMPLKGSSLCRALLQGAKHGSITLYLKPKLHPYSGDTHFPLSKKFKAIPSVKKITARVFWDNKGPFPVDFFDHGKQCMHWALWWYTRQVTACHLSQQKGLVHQVMNILHNNR
jgi:hypothetical protein